MRVLVAGATGGLGRVLVSRLVAEGHDVRALARPSPAGDDLHAVVGGCDALVDVATAVLGDPSDAGAADVAARLRTAETRRLLDAALACGVRHYVQQSIVRVYRDGGADWLDERAPLDDSPARAGVCRPVIEMEGMIRAVDPQQMSWTILRAGWLVGAGTAERALIERLRAGALVVAGDGSNYVSPVNVVDMAAAIAGALECAPAGSTFNIVDEPLHYGDYVDALADLVGSARPRRAAQPLPASWRCRNTAASTVLGWTPRGRIWPHAAG